MLFDHLSNFFSPGEGNGLNIPPAGLLLCEVLAPESCLVLEGVVGDSPGDQCSLSVAFSSTRREML